MLVKKEVKLKGVNKESIFNFFLDPKNIEKTYPSELKPKVRKINGNYELKILLLGQNFIFNLKIVKSAPYDEIVDELEGSIFKSWRNIHRFKEKNGELIIEDEIYYDTKLGFIGNRFAKSFIEKLIEYRNQSLLKIFNNIGEPIFKNPFKISLISGTILLLISTIFSILILLLIPINPIFDFIIGLISWGLLWYSTHDLAHLLFGRAFGIKFTHYYIGFSNLLRISWIPERIRLLAITFGIKIDREKSKKSKSGYAIMYLAGPLASIFTPFIPPIYLILFGSSISGLILLLLSIGNLAFTSYFSPRYGCINKAIRVLSK